MNPFDQKQTAILNAIIHSKHFHSRWLNTLSYLENCGAKKIARSEHPTNVSEEMLKHAAEEFRHAYYLKRQISKLGELRETYSCKSLLGGHSSLRYLDKLEVHICRFLKANFQLSPFLFKKAAYLLITYAIEMRADKLYPLYQELLVQYGSSVSVRSIIVEEDRHLSDVSAALTLLPEHENMKAKACACEHLLFQQLILAIECELDFTLCRN